MGKISMIHFDAHADTGEDQWGALVGHGLRIEVKLKNQSPSPKHRVISAINYACLDFDQPY